MYFNAVYFLLFRNHLFIPLAHPIMEKLVILNYYHWKIRITFFLFLEKDIFNSFAQRKYLRTYYFRICIFFLARTSYILILNYLLNNEHTDKKHYYYIKYFIILFFLSFKWYIGISTHDLFEYYAASLHSVLSEFSNWWYMHSTLYWLMWCWKS